MMDVRNVRLELVDEPFSNRPMRSFRYVSSKVRTVRKVLLTQAIDSPSRSSKRTANSGESDQLPGSAPGRRRHDLLKRPGMLERIDLAAALCGRRKSMHHHKHSH